MRARQLVLMLVTAVSLLAAGCGDDNGNGGESEPAAQDETTTTAAAPAESDATIRVADNPDFGEILVGPNGHTLYLFEKDKGTTTACTGGCATAWPALTSATAPTVGDGLDQAKVSTVNGQAPNHVVYNGHLLYFFASDTAPGEVKGAAVPSWAPLDAAGNKATKKA